MTAAGSGDREIFELIASEERRQANNIELIPSENYTYPEVMAALGSVLTNKYSEGYPGRRYYGGQQNMDAIENIARKRACDLFRAEHANVQPLSGSPMNQAIYFGVLEPGDRILAMDLSHGGHLTHGAPVSHMAKVFDFQRYRSRAGTGDIDFEELRALALRLRPRMILCGYSSYPRELDYGAFRRIADEVDAIAVADVSHIGGLIGGAPTGMKIRKSPAPRRRFLFRTFTIAVASWSGQDEKTCTAYHNRGDCVRSDLGRSLVHLRHQHRYAL